MSRAITFERIKTYLFGVAIGSVLVTMILIAKANQASRRMAEEQAAAQAAEAEQALRAPASSGSR